MSRTGWFLLGIYGVVIGAAAITHQLMAKGDTAVEPKGPVTATIELPANYLLRARDLGGEGSKDDLQNHYTKKVIHQGAEISVADVADVPSVDDRSAGLLELGLNAKAADAGFGNASSSILICRDDQKVTQGSVEAQWCPADGSSCHILVRPDEIPVGVLQGLRAAIETCAVAPTRGPDALK